MLASLFSKPQPSLSVQAKRLVAMRFLIYTGFQTSVNGLIRLDFAPLWFATGLLFEQISKFPKKRCE